MIDQFRLSPIARYDADFQPPARMTSDTDTWLLYNFEEGGGTQLSDSSGHRRHGRVVWPQWMRVGESQQSNCVTVR